MNKPKIMNTVEIVCYRDCHYNTMNEKFRGRCIKRDIRIDEMGCKDFEPPVKKDNE